MRRLILILGLTFGFAHSALAQTPEDTVRWIYTSMAQPGLQGLDYLAAPAQRQDFFSRRMIAFYEANDSHAGDLSRTCVDFGFAVPGNDFDAIEILRSLSLNSSGDTSRTSVTARFYNFGMPAGVTYDFVIEDGLWKIDDIASDGWRVSEIPCTANSTAAPVATNSYCFQTGSDSLQLILAPDGSAQFDMLSWQSNGHSCSGQGTAGVVDGGWLYEEYQHDRLCRLGFSVTPDQGIRLSDADYACKRWMCGQRAVLDGLTFPRTSQIDCSQMRSLQ